jgi:hypothetical protein
VRVAVLEGPTRRSAPVVAALAGGGLNSIVALAAADLDGDGNDEVVMAYAGEDVLHLYTTRRDDKTFSFEPFGLGATVKLDSGAKLRSFNASIAILDVSHDGVLDIVTNAEGCYAHAAYGVGGGRFHSSPQLGVADPDQETSLFDVRTPDASTKDGWSESILLTRRVDSTSPEVQLMTIRCPPSALFSSDVCDAIAGGCEAVAVDLDRDGIEDFVATQGQQVGLLVARIQEGGATQHSFLDTDCPPHNLAAGDFDGDGVSDVAFLDQVPTVGGKPLTALKIAYGNAFAAPSPPRVGGLLERATGLVSGGFPDPPEGMMEGPQEPGERLFAARSFGTVDGDGKYTATSSGITFIKGNSDRQALAPLYVNDVSPENQAPELRDMEILADAAGKFAIGAGGDPAEGLAVIARENGKTPELWLLARSPDDGSPTATRSGDLANFSCAQCVLAAANVDGEGRDELLLFEGKELVVYDAGAEGFAERSRSATDHAFASIEDKNPRPYVPRPLVADLDEPDDDPSDDHLDVVLRSIDGALVVFWGGPGGTFEEKTLRAAPSCTLCAGQAIAQIRLGDAATRKVVVVGPGFLEFRAIKGRKLEPIGVELPEDDVPKVTADYTNVGAADVDGDGVDDLIVMPNSSSIRVFRGIPEVE